MTDLSARLRDVLSDERLRAIDQHAHNESAYGGAEYLEAWRAGVIRLLLPLLSSLQEEREREIRDGLWSLARRRSTTWDLAWQAGYAEGIEAAMRLASSSSPAAPQEQK